MWEEISKQSRTKRVCFRKWYKNWLIQRSWRAEWDKNQQYDYFIFQTLFYLEMRVIIYVTCVEHIRNGIMIFMIWSFDFCICANVVGCTKYAIMSYLVIWSCWLYEIWMNKQYLHLYATQEFQPYSQSIHIFQKRYQNVTKHVLTAM